MGNIGMSVDAQASTFPDSNIIPPVTPPFHSVGVQYIYIKGSSHKCTQNSLESVYIYTNRQIHTPLNSNTHFSCRAPSGSCISVMSLMHQWFNAMTFMHQCDVPHASVMRWRSCISVMSLMHQCFHAMTFMLRCSCTKSSSV